MQKLIIKMNSDDVVPVNKDDLYKLYKETDNELDAAKRLIKSMGIKYKQGKSELDPWEYVTVINKLQDWLDTEGY